MKKLLSFISALGLVALLMPAVAFATPVSWDKTGSVLSPLQSSWSDQVKVPYITATSTTASSTLLNTQVSQLKIGTLSGILRAVSGFVTTSSVNLSSDVTGTLPVANGGTGSTTLSGILIGNGTNPLTTLTIGSGLLLTGTTLSATGGSLFAYPFPLNNTNFGNNANATSSVVGFNAGILASSTSHFDAVLMVNGTSTNAFGIGDYQHIWRSGPDYLDTQNVGSANPYTETRNLSNLAVVANGAESTNSMVVDCSGQNAFNNQNFLDTSIDDYPTSYNAIIADVGAGTCPAIPLEFQVRGPGGNVNQSTFLTLFPSGTIGVVENSTGTSTVYQGALLYAASSTATYLEELDTTPGTKTTIGTSRFSVLGSGKVGIGTSSPSDQLTVSVGNNAGITVDSTNAAFIGIQKAGSDAWRWENDFDNGGISEFLYGNGTGGRPSTAALTLVGNPAPAGTTAGNIGIGTTSPSQLLSVAGNILLSGNITELGVGTSTFTNGINISSGCFSVAGTCIGAGGSGTVTSVALSVPTGLSITGSPITTSGTLALSLTAGYNIPLTASTTNWNSAYNNEITSLTTSGTSGAATLSGGTLNIPNYANTTYTAGTGLTLTGTAFSVNTSQNISILSNLTTAGFVQTTSGGVLSSAALTSSQVTTALGFTPGTGSGTVSSGLTGQFPYYASNGTTLTATSTLFLASTGNIGVGTTSPSKLFTVEGNQSGGIARIQRDTSTAANSVYGTYDVALNELGGLSDQTGPGQTFGVMSNGGAENIYGEIFATRNGADANGALTLAGVVSNTFQTGNAITIDGASNITAIGSSSPSSSQCIEQFCIVNPNAGAAAGLVDVSGTSSPVRLAFNASITSLAGQFGTLSNHPLEFFTNGSIVGEWLSNGNFGIGTTSPFAKLSIGSGSLGFPDGTTQASAGIFVASDQETSGTAGGGATAGGFPTRVLNTVTANTIPGASLASNAITLPAGTYTFTATAPSFNLNKGQLYLFNSTDSATTTTGMTCYSETGGTDEGQATCYMSGAFTIAATKTFILKQYTQLTKATNGLGLSIGQGTEVYANISFQKH